MATRPQSQSVFLSKIPAELRVSIYHYLLPKSEIHISTRTLVPYEKPSRKVNEKLYHIHCQQKSNNRSVWEKDSRSAPPQASWGEHFVCYYSFMRRQGRCGCSAILAVMLTCHQTKVSIQLYLNHLTRSRYKELQHELYSSTVFVLQGIDRTGPARFLNNLNLAASSLKSVVLQWHMYLPVYEQGVQTRIYGELLDSIAEQRRWEKICKVLSKCSNLSNLHIKIFDGGFSPPDDKLLPPLEAIHVENFTVQLPWN